MRVGGDKMDDAIINYIKKHNNLLIGEASAERIKKDIGSAMMTESGTGRSLNIKGRDLISGVPKEITISEMQIAKSLADPIAAIVDGVKNAEPHAYALGPLSGGLSPTRR